MPSYIELDKQASFPSSSNAGNVILGVDTLGQVTLTNNAGQTTPIGGGSGSIDTGSFATTGSNTFNGNQTISGSIKFGNNTQQITITGADTSLAYPNAQRMILQGTQGTGSFGEGGDVYLWAGAGSTDSGSGGDIKVRGGVGYNNQGGYVKIQGGNANYIGGQGGYVLVEGGYGHNSGSGGDITIRTQYGYDGGVSGKIYINTPLNYTTIDDSGTTFTKPVIISSSIYLGSGSIINESGSTLVLTPPTALPGQSLVIRPTAPSLTSNHPSGFYSGDSITITFAPSGGTATGTGSYVFTGCTEVQLGTPLTGSLLFNNEVTQSLTWTVPSISDITGFTFEIYNFATFTSNSISLSSSGSSEHSHIHLISGDPATTDIYLGDDNQYIKIEKNNGNVVIGTNSDTNQWIFDTSGSLITPGDVIVTGSLNITGTTNIRPYKVFTALLTQNGDGEESTFNFFNQQPLTIGRTYFIQSGAGSDFTNVGAPNNSNGTYFIATGTTPALWGVSGILTFNTGAPTAIVLENTIGNVWFTYNNIGIYGVNSDGLFTENKSFFLGGSTFYNISEDTTFSSGFNFNTLTTSTILINTVQVSADIKSDDVLYKTSIEIRVYN
jgi:hypothetical protein